MALTLSFGFIKPESGDAANVWQPSLETDMQLLNDHTHDGVNSSSISPASITVLSASVAGGVGAGLWTDLGGGNYSQNVSAPAAVSEVNNFVFKVYDASGDVLYLTIERMGPTTLTLYTNNPVAMTVLFK